MSAIRPHSAPVSCAAPSPEGRVLASGSYDRRILLWDAHSGEILRELSGHTSLVNGLDWSPDGQWLASAASDHTVRVWHALTGREVACFRGHADDVNGVSWSPDGRRLASASFDGTVRVWTAEGACLLIAGHHRSDVNGVAWLPAGDRLAAASDDGSVSIFDAKDGRVRRILEGHTDWVDQVAVHPDGLRIASAGQDGTARIWNLNNGKEIACLDASTCVVKAVAWSADGSTLAASSYDGKVRVYQDGSFRLLQTHHAEGLWNRTLRYTERGWLTGSFGGGPAVLAAGGPRHLGPQTTGGLNGLALAPDGAHGVVCSDDGNLYEIDLERWQVTRVLGSHRAAVSCAAYSPKGDLVATGSWDRTVRVWDRDSGRCIAEWQGLGDPVNTLVFDGSARVLWIGTFNGDVVSWDLDSHAVAVRGSHHGSIKSIARAEGGAISAGRDGTVRRWSRGGVQRFATSGSILNGVAIDPKGERIATVSRRHGIELWSPAGERLGGFAGHPCSAKAVAWSQDGRRLAGAYYDGHLCVWDPGQNLARVDRVSDHSLSMVAFAGKDLLVTSWDPRGTLLRIDPRTGAREEVRTAA
jgi:WD40 repeat protein